LRSGIKAQEKEEYDNAEECRRVEREQIQGPGYSMLNRMKEHHWAEAAELPFRL
jgi:hypothetical protein